MMLKKIALVISLLMNISLGEERERFRNIMDSALSLANLTWQDLWLPPDLLPNDSFRQKWVNPVFEQPFKTLIITEDLKNMYSSHSKTYNFKVLDSLMSRNKKEAVKIKPQQFSSINDLKSLKIELKSWVERHVKQIKKIHGDSKTSEFKWIVEHTDSLITPDNKYEGYSVFKLKEAEEKERIFTKNFLNKVQTVPFEEIRTMGLTIYQELQMIMGTTNWDSILFPKETEKIKTDFGLIIIGTQMDDVYKSIPLLILDPGGNDRYISKNQNIHKASQQNLSILIDLKGDDFYSGDKYSWASSVGGVSLLWDKQGNDNYFGKDFSIGSGLYGVGILRDQSGNDLYSGFSYSVGSGAFGVGMILDDEGMDKYLGQVYSQGFGFTRGAGAIYDLKGNDHYITSSPFQDFLRYDEHFLSFSQGAGLGMRPYASGGIGTLFDFEGNDNYVSDIFGQGTSYWFSLGVLYDEKGNDSYSAHQYAQGAGVHFAHGILWDRQGIDRYISHGVSQGCGHDVAFGLLRDDQGDDTYQAYGLSQGGGNADAISVFYDGAGSDIYIGRTLGNMMGYSDFRRDYSMIGLFVEGGGKDIYGDTLRNKEIHTKSTLGLFADLDWPQQKNEKIINRGPDAERLDFRLTSTVDSLFLQASTAPEKYRNQVEPARKQVLKISKEKGTMDHLFFKLGTESPRERHALKDIMKRIYAESPKLLLPNVYDSLVSKVKRTRSMAAVVCGKAKVVECIPALSKKLRDKKWQERYSAAFALAQIGEKKSQKDFLFMLKDNHAYVKMRGAYGLGQIVSQKQWIETALKIMKHKEQVVRTGFIQGSIKRNDTLSITFLMNGISRSNKMGIKSLVTGISGFDWDEKFKKEFQKVWKKLDPTAKRYFGYAVVGLQNSALREKAKAWTEIK